MLWVVLQGAANIFSQDMKDSRLVDSFRQLSTQLVSGGARTCILCNDVWYFTSDLEKEQIWVGTVKQGRGGSLSESVVLFLQTFKISLHPNRKSYGAEILRELSPPTICQMSYVRCQVSTQI